MLPHPELINHADVIHIIDGTATPEVLAHYDQCRACRAYIAAQRSIEQSLHRLFRRDECPSVQQITAFLRQELLPAQSELIQQHLNDCKTCTQILDDLKSAFEIAVNQRQNLPLPIMTLPQAILGDQQNLPSLPALRNISWQASAALASAGEPASLVAQIDDSFICLTIIPDDHYRYTIEGQTSGGSGPELPFINWNVVVQVNKAIPVEQQIANDSIQTVFDNLKIMLKFGEDLENAEDEPEQTESIIFEATSIIDQFGFFHSDAVVPGIVKIVIKEPRLDH